MAVFPHKEAFQDAGNCNFKVGTKEINPFRWSEDSNMQDEKKKRERELWSDFKAYIFLYRKSHCRIMKNERELSNMPTEWEDRLLSQKIKYNYVIKILKMYVSHKKTEIYIF